MGPFKTQIKWFSSIILTYHCESGNETTSSSSNRCSVILATIYLNKRLYFQVIYKWKSTEFPSYLVLRHHDWLGTVISYGVWLLEPYFQTVRTKHRVWFERFETTGPPLVRCSWILRPALGLTKVKLSNTHLYILESVLFEQQLYIFWIQMSKLKKNHHPIYNTSCWAVNIVI